MYSVVLMFLLCAGSSIAQDKPGLLVLAHGGSGIWERMVTAAVAPLRQKYPTEIAFGMADPKTIQKGLNNLEKKGVRSVIVVPLFISSHSPIIRQTEYLLGLREDLPDEPLVMNHAPNPLSLVAAQSFRRQHSHGSDDANKERDQVVIKPIASQARIMMTKPLDDDSLVASILYERIQGVSQADEDETVILVAHGPNDEEDNKGWLEKLTSLADQIQSKRLAEKGRGFKSIKCTTVRDDAKESVYDEAKMKLRDMVKSAGSTSRVIVVPVVLALGGIEAGIRRRLEGLEYVWVKKALLPHENVTRFIEMSVTKVLTE